MRSALQLQRSNNNGANVDAWAVRASIQQQRGQRSALQQQRGRVSVAVRGYRSAGELGKQREKRPLTATRGNS